MDIAKILAIFYIFNFLGLARTDNQSCWPVPFKKGADDNDDDSPQT